MPEFDSCDFVDHWQNLFHLQYRGLPVFLQYGRVLPLIFLFVYPQFIDPLIVELNSLHINGTQPTPVSLCTSKMNSAPETTFFGERQE